MDNSVKRIGYLPRKRVLEIIDKISQTESISRSKVVGILVEEALGARGIDNFAFGNKINLNNNKIQIKSELEKAEEALKLFRERNRSIFESPQLQLEQERLGRDVAVLISVFTTLKQQLETAKIEEVKESDYVIILDIPDIPLYPDKPKKKLMVILAGILGIGLGMILAFIKEFVI